MFRVSGTPTVLRLDLHPEDNIHPWDTLNVLASAYSQVAAFIEIYGDGQLSATGPIYHEEGQGASVVIEGSPSQVGGVTLLRWSNVRDALSGLRMYVVSNSSRWCGLSFTIEDTRIGFVGWGAVTRRENTVAKT